MSNPTSSGLEGTIVAETAISDVDGERGRLVIAGSDVEQLAAAGDYERAVQQVLSAGGARVSEVKLGAARLAAWEMLARVGDALDTTDAMDALRTGLGHLRPTGDDTADAIAALGAAPVLVAAWNRKRMGAPPIGPDPTLDHATDYLRMSTGSAPSREAATALDVYLVTVIDHAMSASTFTARVIASTGSDLISAIVGAVGALKGPLHGGAPGPVLDMLDAIGEPARAEAWILGELAANRRIMGMGHRVYRVRDPRAAVLETAVRPLAGKHLDPARQAEPGSLRLGLARAVEAAASKILRERKPDRPLAANVEFYTAVLLDAVGLPREQFSATFAISRIAGWSAHVIEQRRVGKLIRPASRYVGATP